MPHCYKPEAEYYLVEGWFEKSNGISDGVFHGACCLPDSPLRPVRVAIHGEKAIEAAGRAATQDIRIHPVDLMEGENTDGDYWYNEGGKWVCRPGKRGDGGKLCNPEATEFQGLEITIENPAGSTRSGVDEDGHEWETKMKYDYGFLRRVKGADDEGVDVYVGPVEDAEFAYVVHQNCPDTKQFDEDKVMLGFGTAEKAREAYLAHYDNPDFFGSMTAIPIDTFKEAVNSKGDKFKWKSKGPQVGVKIEEMVGCGAIADRPVALTGSVGLVEPEVITRDENPTNQPKKKKKPKLPHSNHIGPRMPTISQSGGRLGGNG